MKRKNCYKSNIFFCLPDFNIYSCIALSFPSSDNFVSEVISKDSYKENNYTYFYLYVPLFTLNVEYYFHSPGCCSLFSPLVMSNSETLWTAAHQAFLSFSNTQSLLKLMSTESLMSSISSPATPFSSCLQSFPASGSFPVSWLFTSGGQSIGTPAPTSVLPMNI